VEFFFTHRVFPHKKVLTHPESQDTIRHPLLGLRGSVGIDNPRKEMSKCGITICGSYISLINIGDESVSLALIISE
jgi:hypothetical protein